MGNFKINVASIALAVSCVLGLAGPISAFAATAPSLGSAGTYGVVSSTYTNSNTALQTIINGDVCYTTGPVTSPMTITGITDTPCNPAVGTAQNSALNNVVDGLNVQSCTSLGTNVVLSGTYTPGCYSSSGSMDIVLSTAVTLNGPGVYIFRSGGALTTGANSSVVLTNGATASNVFWAPVGAATLGANTTFVGSILDAAGISLGHFATLVGRALAFGGTVLTDANTISVPSTIHVIKQVVNTGGGVATVSNFNLHVKLAGVDVSGSPATGTTTPGTAYSLSPGTYVVSEDTFAGYTQTFSGNCDVNGNIILGSGDDKTCTVTNTYIIPPATPSSNPQGINQLQDGTINVVKVVINDNGGTKTIADFPLFVNGMPVVSGVTNSFSSQTYLVSETVDSHYTQSFSGDCTFDGHIGLNRGENKVCIITNDDIGTTVVVPPVPPLIDVVKVPNPLALPGGPGPVTYTYTLRNTGTVPVTDITMVGDTCSPIVPVSGDVNGDAKLDLNEVWVYRCSTVLSATHTNTVTATGWANGMSAVDIANATVVVGVPGLPNTGFVSPLIHVTKVPTRLTPFPFGGGNVMYSYTVTNPGVVPLRNVVITDDKCGSIHGPFGDTNGNNLLDPGEGWAYACWMNLTRTTTNTAIVSGEANGLRARDFAIATALVSPPGLPNTGLPPQSASSVAHSSGKGITKAEAIAAFHRSLSIGIEGTDVEALQTALEKKGLLVMPYGVIKGHFGELTRAAVAKYQMSVGLPSAGMFGPLTTAKLILELAE